MIVVIEEGRLIELLEQAVEKVVRREMSTLKVEPEMSDDSIMNVREIEKHAKRGYQTIMNRIRVSKVERFKKDGVTAIRFKYVKELFKKA